METSRQERSMRYLLGKLSEEETTEFEAQCFEDDDLFLEMSDLENDLLHSYVRGELSQAERREFEVGYLISPARREKVEFARGLEHRLFGAAAIAVSPETTQRSTSKPIRAGLAIQSWRMRLVSGAVALAVVAAISWLAITNHRLNSELGQMRAEQMELRRTQQELQAKLLALTSQMQETASSSPGQQQLPHPRPHGPDIIAFNLMPGLPRGAGTIRQLIVPAGIRLVELKLYLEEGKYSSYRALLETLEGKQVQRKAGLKSQADSQGHEFVSLEIRPAILHNGDYLVKLDGVMEAGRVEESISAYRFLVLRP